MDATVYREAARWLRSRLDALDGAATALCREATGTAILTVVCSWCHEVIVQGNSDLVSHGICPSCKAKLQNEGAIDRQ
jgi:hypothetical protein